MKALRFAPVILLLAACSSAPNKFNSNDRIKIYEFTDRRQGDSLIQYLQHSDASLRAEACLAFGSIQDSTLAYWLGNILLEDTDENVRANAAFSLGQTPGHASVNALIPALTDKSPMVVREVLEALGKTVSVGDIKILLSAQASDTLPQIGMAYALYRLGLRNLADSIVVKKAAQFLSQDYNDQTRSIAANFFSRGIFTGTSFQTELIRAAKTDPNVYVRMAAVSGLRKIQNDESLKAIEHCLKNDVDYRVRANAARALQPFTLTNKRSLYNALLDSQINVSIAASEVVKQVATAADANDLKAEIKKIQNWRVRTNVIEVVVKLDTAYASVAIDQFNRSANEYEKAWLLGAINQSPHTIDFIATQVIDSKIPVIKSQGTLALATLARNVKDSQPLISQLATVFRNIILDGDAGAIGIAASILSDQSMPFRSVVKDYSFLTTAKNNLKLPKDIETLQPLEEAIAFFEGKERPQPPVNPFNHPIDWKFVKSIPATQKVLIKTTQGEIVLQLLVNEAPGSVANFIALTKQEYFNNKFFHRVVPNFVVQTGCNRGDGYGSEDYSIRSEFSRRRYDEGSVGMASAGKDTEGTQWFITHSPTPHLDGRYTIFATVVSGMEAVHSLEVGDKILEVVLQD